MSIEQHTKNTIGVVLAGGMSSRMGKDKALLRIDAQSMIDRSAGVLRQTSVNKVLISRNDGGKNHTPDIIPGKGPLSGIHSIASRFPNHNLLVLPVDLPLMDASTLQAMIDCAKHTMQSIRYTGNNLPLFIQNTRAFRQLINYTVECTDRLSVKHLCSQLPLVELTAEISSTMFNTNTPEQWQFAIQHLNTSSVPVTEAAYESFK